MRLTDIHLTPADATRLLSREIRHLQHRLERLEHGMEHFYAARNGRLGTVAVTALQELDMLAQSTDALAAYVEKLSLRVDADTVLDLSSELSAIPLRTLSRRLSGATQEDLAANAPELF
ncbi:chemotaxis protein [Salipiger sp. P9]|uniref:chemotaxis protein n=1 Tax=Salipiger pentaromativorans TaxID=2943193 RepID=UPI002156FBAE|nr:chemotaxis protein [Salipiger pentaromativorans]MCR8549800.1 chemotaxis protein [Salipiger pentaromativorans]